MKGGFRLPETAFLNLPFMRREDVRLFFKEMPASGEPFFCAAHPSLIALRAVFDDGGQVEADLAV